MNLWQQAQRDVQAKLAAHGPDFSTFRAWLDQGWQEAGGYWEHPLPDFLSIDPGVRGGHVRQVAAGLAVRHRARGLGLQTLRLQVKPLAGLHLFTPDGWRIRTRKRPLERKTRKPMRVSSELDPLFGEEDFQAAPPAGAVPLLGYDPSAQPYQLSVLMDIDLGTRTLRAASLAAIDWGKDDKGQKIYYEEEIPAQPIQLGSPGSGANGPGAPGNWTGPGSGFDDFLRDEGEETGSDSA
jgi:hypothetical protein